MGEQPKFSAAISTVMVSILECLNGDCVLRLPSTQEMAWASHASDLSRAVSPTMLDNGSFASSVGLE